MCQLILPLVVVGGGGGGEGGEGSRVEGLSDSVGELIATSKT
jgi:hypothetical protein